MKLLCVLVLVLCFATLGAGRTWAQGGDVQARIVRVEGVAFLDGKRLDASVSQLALSGGSILRTSNSRVAVLSGGGDSLFLDRNSSVRFVDSPLRFGRYELVSGSVVIVTGQLGPAVECAGEVQLSDAGVFEFSVHPVLDQQFCRMRVYKGAAAARLPSFQWVLTGGKTVDLNRRCGDHVPRNVFDTKQADDLVIWAQAHGN